MSDYELEDIKKTKDKLNKANNLISEIQEFITDIRYTNYDEEDTVGRLKKVVSSVMMCIREDYFAKIRKYDDIKRKEISEINCKLSVLEPILKIEHSEALFDAISKLRNMKTKLESEIIHEGNYYG